MGTRTIRLLFPALLAMVALPDGNAAPGDKPNPAWGKEQDRCTLQVGDPAPDFTLKDPSGKTSTSLSGLKGKPVVLLFGSYT